MAANPMIECLSTDLVPKYCQGRESRVVYTAPPHVVESLQALSKKSSPAIASACRGNDSNLVNVEHLYRSMPSHSPHPDTTLVRCNVRSLTNRENLHKGGPSGNCQLPPAMRLFSVLDGKRDFSQ